MLNNKTILITGGTGSFGQYFIKNVLKKFKIKKIIVYSRDEFKQLQLRENLNQNFLIKNKLRFFIGDVRDKERLSFALKDVDIAIHAAALKQVPATEYNPFEAVKTNIIGAQNIIDGCLENNVKQLVALSTDKAASPINLYGATKLASDKIIIASNNVKGKKNYRASVVRYGNVMGSRGSVVPYFLKNKYKKNLEITHNEMTRFNITLQQGVDFVLFCLSKMSGGEIFVPKIPSIKVTDLAKVIAPKARHKIIGIRPGEKLHEEMITESDSINTLNCKKYFIIMPHSEFTNLRSKILAKNKGSMCKYPFSYNSKNNVYLKTKEISKLINNL